MAGKQMAGKQNTAKGYFILMLIDSTKIKPRNRNSEPEIGSLRLYYLITTTVVTADINMDAIMAGYLRV